MFAFFLDYMFKAVNDVDPVVTRGEKRRKNNDGLVVIADDSDVSSSTTGWWLVVLQVCLYNNCDLVTI